MVGLLAFISCNKSDNRKLLQSCKKDSIDLPTSDFFTAKPYFKSGYLNIYILNSKTENNSYNPTIIYDNSAVSLNELDSIITERIGDFKSINLFVDKDIQMNLVQSIKSILRSRSLLHIRYAVNINNSFMNFSKFKFIDFVMLPRDFTLEATESNCFTNIIDLRTDSAESFFINNKLIDRNILSKTIQELMVNDTNYVVLLNINETQRYEIFIDMLSASRKAVYTLRDSVAIKMYSKKYNSLNKEETITIRTQFPCRDLDIDGESPIITKIIIIEE
jgi:hypothetical protein